MNGLTSLDLSGLGFGVWNDSVDRVIIIGGGGAQTITGTTQADSISGGQDEDTLIGGDGADTLDGGTGASSLVIEDSWWAARQRRLHHHLGSGRDRRDRRRHGRRGPDDARHLHAGRGARASGLPRFGPDGSARQRLRQLHHGGAAEDAFTGGLGADTLIGGAGEDNFQYNSQAELTGDSIDGGTAVGAFIGDYASIGFSGTADFTGVTIQSSGTTSLEAIGFFGGGGHNAIFNASQFNANGIAGNLYIAGDTVSGSLDIVTINGVSGAFDASAFQFDSWDATDRIVINGGSGSDTITGTGQPTPHRRRWRRLPDRKQRQRHARRRRRQRRAERRRQQRPAARRSGFRHA